MTIPPSEMARAKRSWRSARAGESGLKPRARSSLATTIHESLRIAMADCSGWNKVRLGQTMAMGITIGLID